METLNTACRRILEAKYKLGLFDNPYKYCDPNVRHATSLPKRIVMQPAELQQKFRSSEE